MRTLVTARVTARMAAVALSLFLFCGCGEKAPSPGAGAPQNGAAVLQSTDGPQAAAEKPAVSKEAHFGLDDCMALWAKDDKDGAVAALMATDWAKPVSPDSVLAMSEAKFVMRSLAAREKLDAELTPQLDSIRDLCRYVTDLARTAGPSDPVKVRAYMATLKQCGEYLSRPGAVAIGRLVGDAISKRADSELQKLEIKR